MNNVTVLGVLKINNPNSSILSDMIIIASDFTTAIINCDMIDAIIELIKSGVYSGTTDYNEAWTFNPQA
ncbi:hypothetical protein VCHA53O466_320055 [Vibrio chagasii]|nr:hypothetical protein VCHA53O466_320055 [Vibrio chagasii]